MLRFIAILFAWSGIAFLRHGAIFVKARGGISAFTSARACC